MLYECSLAKEFEVNEKTIERDIEELKRAGKIKFIGSKRSGHYESKIKKFHNKKML